MIKDCSWCGCPKALWLLWVACPNPGCRFYSSEWYDQLDEEQNMVVIWWLLKQRDDQ